MTEIEKIEYTKAFIDKLADGINPLTDQAIPEGDLLNNVRISRCMFYVSGILGGVIEQMKHPVPVKRIKNADKNIFYIDESVVRGLTYEQGAVYVGDVVSKLNGLIDENAMRKLKVKTVYEWLVEKEILYNVTESAKTYRKATEKGKEMGFSDARRISRNGFGYTVTLCNASAQKFIAENANEIAQSEKVQEREKGDGQTEQYEMQGQPWTEEQDKKLAELFNSGLTLAAISKELKRSPASVRARLLRLGLISQSSEIV